jgi:hypothetical protein
LDNSGVCWKFRTIWIGWHHTAKLTFGSGVYHGMNPPRGYKIHELLQQTVQLTKEVTDSSQSRVSVIYIAFSSQPASWQAHFNLRKCVWKEKLFWNRYSGRSTLWDREEGRKQSWFQEIADGISAERICVEHFCPIEDFKSRFSLCFCQPCCWACLVGLKAQVRMAPKRGS